jgi:prevent-host-death family protein
MSGQGQINSVPPVSTIVNVSEAKMHLSRLLEDVAAGGEVVITKYGEPVARLLPVEIGVRPKKLGLLRGKIKVPADFNAPLSPDELADFEGYRRFVAKV